MLHFHVKTEHFYIVDNYNNTKVKYSYVSMATVISEKVSHSYVIPIFLILLYII